MVHAIKARMDFGRGAVTSVFIEPALDASGDALHGVAAKGRHLAQEQHVNPALFKEIYGFLKAVPEDLKRALFRSLVLTRG